MQNVYLEFISAHYGLVQLHFHFHCCILSRQKPRTGKKKKEKKLRTYFRITSFSLRTFFVYHIGKFFDGSISKCLPMYLFRIESSLGMFIIVQHFNLTFYSDDHRTSFPCGRLKRVQIDFGKKLNFYMVNNFIWNRFSQSIVHLNSRNSSAKYLAFSR